MTDVQTLVTIEVTNVLNQFQKQSRSQLASAVKRFTDSLKREQSSVSKNMMVLHRHVAIEAQNTIKSAYASSGLGRKPSYRDQAEGKMRRYSGGAMTRALAQPEIIRFDSRRLYFMDKQKMDKVAKQWYRLNFGAGPKGRGGNQPRIKNWQMGKTRINYTLSLAGFNKSANFKVPHSLRFSGAWSSTFSPTNLSLSEIRDSPAGSGGALYLVPMRRATGGRYWESRHKKGRRGYKIVRGQMSPESGTNRGTWSKGIRGAHYLEKGVDVINVQYPRQLNSLMTTWFDVSKDAIGRRRPFVWQPI